MTGRTFTLLLIAAVAIGIGAAIGVIAYMERGDDEPGGQPAFAELPQPSASGGQTAAAAPSAPQPDGAAIVSPEGVETLAGTVESVEGRSLSIATEEGSETATVEQGATVTLFLERSPDDLEEGMSVTLTGERGEDGVTRASLIMLGDAGPGAFGGPGGAPGVGVLRVDGGQINPEDIAALRANLARWPPVKAARFRRRPGSGSGRSPPSKAAKAEAPARAPASLGAAAWSAKSRG